MLETVISIIVISIVLGIISFHIVIGITNAAKQRAAEELAAKKAAAKKRAAKKVAAKKPGTDVPDAEEPVANKRTPKKVAAKKPAAKKPAVKKPAAKKPAAKKPAAKKSTSAKTTAKKPAAKSASEKPSSLDDVFLEIVKRISLERGFSFFEDYTKCKSLLADYTAGEYKKESRLFLLAIEAGCPGEIARSTDPEISRNKLVNKLHDEFSLDQIAAEQVVDLLYEVDNEGATK